MDFLFFQFVNGFRNLLFVFVEFVYFVIVVFVYFVYKPVICLHDEGGPLTGSLGLLVVDVHLRD